LLGPHGDLLVHTRWLPEKKTSGDEAIEYSESETKLQSGAIQSKKRRTSSAIISESQETIMASEQTLFCFTTTLRERFRPDSKPLYMCGTRRIMFHPILLAWERLSELKATRLMSFFLIKHTYST
jgi:hypothetical protein